MGLLVAMVFIAQWMYIRRKPKKNADEGDQLHFEGSSVYKPAFRYISSTNLES